MPIYEFYCGPCHRIYNFLSRTIDTERAPDCPRCGEKQLTRHVSAFAISKGRPERAADEDQGMPDLDEGKLAELMQRLGPEAESMDESDPRQAARVMRGLFEAAGLPVAGGMEEALKRMEAGEDPEKVEQDMGEALEGDPFAAGGTRPALSRLRRRLLPPSVDAHLYEL
jgi:putative FmdB family regulatory protein